MSHSQLRWCWRRSCRSEASRSTSTRKVCRILHMISRLHRHSGTLVSAPPVCRSFFFFCLLCHSSWLYFLAWRVCALYSIAFECRISCNGRSILFCSNTNSVVGGSSRSGVRHTARYDVTVCCICAPATCIDYIHRTYRSHTCIICVLYFTCNTYTHHTSLHCMPARSGQARGDFQQERALQQRRLLLWDVRLCAQGPYLVPRPHQWKET